MTNLTIPEMLKNNIRGPQAESMTIRQEDDKHTTQTLIPKSKSVIIIRTALLSSGKSRNQK